MLLQAALVDTAQIINAMGIMPFTGGIWDAGLSMRVGMEILLEEVNANPNILPGYQFNFLWMNGGCTGIDASSFVLDALFDRTFQIFAPNRTLAELDVNHDGYVTTQETASMTQTWGMDTVGSFPVAVVPTCSREVMKILELVNKGRMAMVSPGATNPVLSDRTTYPNFFRTVMPDTFSAAAWVTMVKVLGQSSIVSVLGPDTDIYLGRGPSLARAAMAAGLGPPR